ncbi:MAG: hypothetical protein AAGA23_15395 [Pseudomonadota bacterium]
MTRTELLVQLRHFVVSECSADQLLWWSDELRGLARHAEKRAQGLNDESPPPPPEVPPPFLGTG